MSVLFNPCPACARHVKQGEGICPFCGEKMARTQVLNSAAPTSGRATRVSRAVLFAASAAGVALSTTGCGTSNAAAVPALPPDSGSATERDADIGDGRVSGDEGPTFTPEAGLGEISSNEAGEGLDGAPVSNDDGAAGATSNNDGGVGGANTDAERPRFMPVYGGPIPPIDSPRSPGGPSEPADRPAADAGMVVRPRRLRRRPRR